MTVALVGPAEDAQIEAVADALASRDADADVWDVHSWPGETPLAFEQRPDGAQIVRGGRPIDPADYDAIYRRGLGLDPRYPRFADDLEERPLATLNQVREYRGLLESTIEFLADRGVAVVNPLEAPLVHRRKPRQLAALADAGVPVPETLATNDPDAVRAFVDRVGEVIYKPIGGGGHARPLAGDELTDGRLARLANAPVQFQARLRGADLRIFVLDGEVVGAGRIVSEELDYRTADHDVERLEPSALDGEIERAAIRAASALELPFSGVDVIDGCEEFHVLEANPSPMFATFDELAGTSVADSLAAFLAAGG